jgi:NAD(P)H dehydrogenase (quinone)
MRFDILARVLACALALASAAFAQKPTTVLSVYHSQQGHTRTMAEAVARGARSVEGITVRLTTIDQTQKDDLLGADAIIVGSPVHNGNITPDVAAFIGRWPWAGAPLRDKLGACFVTAGGISAGEELAQMNILHSMMIYGMIVVGGADWTSAFGASAITAETPFEKQSADGAIADQFQKKGEELGKRVARLSLRLKGEGK